MTDLPDVVAGQPGHAAAHNAERHAINALQDTQVTQDDLQTVETAVSAAQAAANAAVGIALVL